MLTRLTGYELAVPAFISLTMTVPASVPSLFQSSVPLTPSFAAKNSMPLTFVKEDGYELDTPEVYILYHEPFLSIRSVAPPELPAACRCKAEKYTVPLKLIIHAGLELFAPVLMFFTMTRSGRSAVRFP